MLKNELLMELFIFNIVAPVLYFISILRTIKSQAVPGFCLSVIIFKEIISIGVWMIKDSHKSENELSSLSIPP